MAAGQNTCENVHFRVSPSDASTGTLHDAADTPIVDGGTQWGPLSAAIEKGTVCSAVEGTLQHRSGHNRKNACRHRRPVDDGTVLLNERRRAQTPLSRVHTSRLQPLQLLRARHALLSDFSITSKHRADVCAKWTSAAHFVIWTNQRWLSMWKVAVHRQ